MWEEGSLFFASLNTQFRPHNNWIVLLELMREWQTSARVNTGSFGVAYLVNPNFQINIGIQNLVDPMNENISSLIALCYRFNTLKIK
ncbi:MAG: hypothetical protein ACI9YL_001868 [Luteibaculaceae bacterium]